MKFASPQIHNPRVDLRPMTVYLTLITGRSRSASGQRFLPAQSVAALTHAETAASRNPDRGARCRSHSSSSSPTWRSAQRKPASTPANHVPVDVSTCRRFRKSGSPSASLNSALTPRPHRARDEHRSCDAYSIDQVVSSRCPRRPGSEPGSAKSRQSRSTRRAAASCQVASLHRSRDYRRPGCKFEIGRSEIE